MREILLARHGQARINVRDGNGARDIAAFGNMESPLTDKGVRQAAVLGEVLRTEFEIDPLTYTNQVAASEYTRSQQTANHAGFTSLDVLPLINESDVDREIMSGRDVIEKHRRERWVPEETKERTKVLFEQIRSGDLPYDIYFSHGMFIAGFLLECLEQQVEVNVSFTEERGYVPLQAAVVKVTL